MKIILKWFILAVAIIFTAWIIPGVEISGVWAALWLALFFGLINITLKPILIILTLPVNILTLGFFTFVINALLIQLSSLVIKGFFVDGFWIAMLFSIVLSVISYIFNKFFGLKK